ncbi:hypothetical protein BDP27DRAFT_705111 [Rhodocollybia butyracea]|uniref:Uncharacterized protein n=1 Tax=Rhodocollybia butyracea TaxID=206335 RepID=A0A9P5Q204_9AGAR|nr:hypothetical protein BDP27DRAFT_705111 [Rhodocollybia butyracea]
MSEKELDNSQQDELSSQFYRSRADVTQFMEWIDQQYTRPALKKTQLSFQKHPVPSVFAAVFTILSIAPVSIYIGLCVFSLALLLLSALSVVILVFFAVASLLGTSMSRLRSIAHPSNQPLPFDFFHTLSGKRLHFIQDRPRWLYGWDQRRSSPNHRILPYLPIGLSC